jgi:predicted nucleic acid-binding protein
MRGPLPNFEQVESSTEARPAAGELESYLRLSLASCGVIMRRVVIDTNVFVAAGFNPRSAAARILAAVREGRFQLIWNEPTRRETEMILRRIPHLHWERVSDLFQPETEFTGPIDPESFALVPDPEDRKFAALGAAAQTPLVTNDHHLLSHRNSIGIDVLTPRAFLAREGEDT